MIPLSMFQFFTLSFMCIFFLFDFLYILALFGEERDHWMGKGRKAKKDESKD